jgi:hypothetical protein
LDFVLACSRQDVKKADAERALHLGRYVNLEDDEDDAGPSQWRGDDGGQGYNTWAAKDEPPSDDDGGGGANYVVFYQSLGMN